MKKLTLCALVVCGGFMLKGCLGGAAELTTAKQAITKAETEKAKQALIAKDPAKLNKSREDVANLYKTAQSNLQVEVAKGSTSANIGEAWFLLGKVSKELNRNDSMLIAFKQADKFLGTEKKEDKQYRSELAQLTFEAWANAYNEGVKLYNEAVGIDDEKGKKEKLKESFAQLNGATELKPENADIYPLVSVVQQALGDTVAGTATQEKYLAFHQPAVEALSKREIILGAERSATQPKLGAPAATKGTAPMPDSVVMDSYPALDGNNIAVFYPRNKEGKFTLEGFRVNLPATWASYEKDRFYAFDNRVNLYVAYYYYTRKDYDKALKYIDNALLMQPSNEDFLNFQSQLYTESGKIEQALAKVKGLAEKFPDNKTYAAQYGSMLSNAGKYDEAIAQFDRAIKVDPKFDLALFNMAAAYKNKAGVVQKEEQEKADKNADARKKDKKLAEYKMDNTKYFPFLKKSAEYFEEYRKLPGKDRDAQATSVLEQLLNIYEVLDDKAQYNKLAGEFISLEYANEKNPRYYEALARLYGKKKDSAKVKECLDKADALRKAGAK